MANIKIVKPRIVEVEPDEVRAPVSNEIYLSHGVELDTLRSGQLGALSLKNPNSPGVFKNGSGMWHADPQFVELHITLVGSCRAKLACIVTNGSIQTELYVVDDELASRLDQKCVEVDLGEKDLLVFNGAWCDTPTAHNFVNLSADRLSYEFMHKPSGV